MPMNWSALLNTLAPVVGEVASSGQRGDFLTGFQAAQERKRKQREQADLVKQNQTKASAEYRLNAMQKLLSIDDPNDFEVMRHALAQTGSQAFGMQPGELDDVTFSDEKRRAKAVQDAQSALDALTKGLDAEQADEYLNQLVEGGSSVTVGNKQMPVAVLRQAVRPVPTGADGQAIPRPKKTPPATAGSETERAAALLQKISDLKTKGDTAGASAAQAQYDALIRAKKELGAADDRPLVGRDPGLVDLDKQLKQLQIDAEGAKLQAARDKQTDADNVTAAKRKAALSIADDVTAVIDRLLDPKTGQLTQGAAAITGARIPFASKVPGSAAANAQADVDRLMGLLSVDLLRELKSQSATGATGFGALSERELDVLQSAATTLGKRNVQDASFAQELKRIRDKVNLVYSGGAAPAAPAAGGTIRARDPQGTLHEAPAGTPLPSGWVLER